MVGRLEERRDDTVYTRVIMASWLALPQLSQEDPGLLVSADWLSDHLADPQVVVLHADMQKSRYEAGHIPGARFLE
ncbi:MAG: hypothetical protein Ct9H300mP15_00190 [Gemmatimonadota bacterium]|nr:MAG: hypothetical protein Ct9H300mP15_00190 [Gemmatimonadota bacterium]